MALELTRIRCEECPNTDPRRFTRTYFEEATQKLLAGVWTTVRSREAHDGQDTLTSCDRCGAAGLEETYDPTPDHRPYDPTGLATGALASLTTGDETPTPPTRTPETPRPTPSSPSTQASA